MQRSDLVIRILVLLVFFGGGLVAQDEHPSIISRVFATYEPAKVEEHTPEVMARAAVAFLDALGPKLRGRAALSLNSPERRQWTNVPPRGNEGGLRLGECDATQSKRACDLLAAVLSRQGYDKIRDIILADDRLLVASGGRRRFGAPNFWLMVFGKPSPDGEWGLQLDGHHVALNMSMRGDRVGMSPSFIGTQPSVFKFGGRKIVPMRGEVEDAFVLVNALTPEQRKKAIVGERRGRMAAGAGKDGVVPKLSGVRVANLDRKQRTLLVKLLGHYVGDLPEPYATRRMNALQSELDAMVFAWNGPTTKGSDISYRIQGPSLIVEYAGQDLGGDPLQHLHSMYRDPTNEYGAGFSR